MPFNLPDANVTLQQSDFTVSEADGSIEVCAILTAGVLKRNITVDLNAAGGTATGE